jgi:hypothetical protein
MAKLNAGQCAASITAHGGIDNHLAVMQKCVALTVARADGKPEACAYRTGQIGGATNPVMTGKGATANLPSSANFAARLLMSQRSTPRFSGIAVNYALGRTHASAIHK